MKGLAAVVVLALIWAAGLLAFAGRVERSTPAATPKPAEGIVVLTGQRASERIKAGMRLLEDGDGQRLLVSGVNRKASREDIRTVGRGVRRLYDCCVDLGYEAATTLGNAREIAAWSKARGYDRLIVVTADYHMPRAMLELRGALPGVELQPYPVTTGVVNAQRWWRTAGGAKLMTVEYVKYLAILGREAVLSLGPREPARAPKAGPA